MSESLLVSCSMSSSETDPWLWFIKANGTTPIIEAIIKQYKRTIQDMLLYYFTLIESF